MDIILAAAAAVGAEGGGFSLDQMWVSMGLFAKGVFVFLVLMSLTTVTLFVERLIVYFSAIRQSRLAAEVFQTTLPEGKWDETLKTAREYKGSHLAKVVGAGADDFLTSAEMNPVEKAEGIRRSMERARDREVARLRRGLGVVATVGSTAPFIGLLGTVVGIVNAFKQIAATGSGGLASVSAGISEALITTAVGLLVAIPGVMAFNYLSSVVDRLSLDMSDAAMEVYDVVMRRAAKSGQPSLRQVQG